MVEANTTLKRLLAQSTNGAFHLLGIYNHPAICV
jgi:hypothetical protein